MRYQLDGANLRVELVISASSKRVSEEAVQILADVTTTGAMFTRSEMD